MRIARIDAEPTDPDRLRLTIRADTGLVGLAGGCLPGRSSSVVTRLTELTPALIGFDPFDTEALIDRFLVRSPGRAGDVDATAVSMVEIACRDLVGRSLGVPVYNLIGGKVRDRVAATAVGWLPRERSPEGASRAARGLVSRGFRSLALTPFGPGPTPPDPSPLVLRDAVRLAESVRAAVGPEVRLRIDLEGRLLPGAVSRFHRMLERVDPVAAADPVAPEHLPIASAVPVSAGHRLNLREEFFALLGRRGCDSIRVDLGRCGGFTEAKKIAALAESHGVTVTLRNLADPVSAAAALHLAATLTNLNEVEIEDDSTSTHVVIDGAMIIPDGPGLNASV